MKFLNGIDLANTEIKNACLQSLAANPIYKDGLFFYRTADKLVVVGVNGAFDFLIPGTMLGAASGVATLSANSKVVQDPANAQTVAAANKIPVAGAGGKLDVAWLPLGAGNGIDADKLDNQDGSYYLNRANHTGTQLAGTISDFMTTVFGARLDQLAMPTAAVDLNNQRLVNVPTVPATATDAVNAAYVDQKLQGLGSKHSVKAATTANITLSGLQASDGVALVNSDYCLVWKQTNAAENGIYLVNTGAWSRASEADTWSKLVSAYCFVEQGATYGDCGFTCTVDQGGALGTTGINWVQFSKAGVYTVASAGTVGQSVFKQQNGTVFELRSVSNASSKILIALDAVNNAVTVDVSEANLTLDNIGGNLSVNKGGTGGTSVATAKTSLGFMSRYAANIGDGVAANIVVTHNLNIRDVQVSVYETASPYNMVWPDVQMTSVNTVTLGFASAPTAGQYRVVVVG